MVFNYSLHSKDQVIDGKECVVLYTLVKVAKELLPDTVSDTEFPGFYYSSSTDVFLKRDLVYWELNQETKDSDLYIYAIFYTGGKKHAQKINIGRDLSKVTQMISELQAEFEDEIMKYFNMLLMDYL